MVFMDCRCPPYSGLSVLSHLTVAFADSLGQLDFIDGLVPESWIRSSSYLWISEFRTQKRERVLGAW